MRDSSANALLGLESIPDPLGVLSSLFEDAPVAFQLYGADGRCVAVNRAFQRVFGDPASSDHADERAAFSNLIRRALAGEEQRATVYRSQLTLSERPDEREQPRIAIQATFVPLRDGSGRVQHVAVGFEDVTAEMLLRSTAEALERSEQRFRGTFEQAAVGMAHVAPDGTWLEVNRRLCDIVGYTREELLVRTFQDITYPPDLSADLELVEKVLSGASSTYSLEKRYVRKDGSLVWIDLTVSLVRDAAGTPQYFISVIQDISGRKEAEERLGRAHRSLEQEVAERRRAEAALRENERGLATTLDSIDDAVIATDREGLVTRMNPVAQQLTGWPLAEARGRTLDDVFRIRRRGASEEANDATSASRGMPVETLAPHTVLVGRGGEERAIASSIAPIRDAVGVAQGLVIVFRDQTNERAAEQALRESEATKAAILDAALDCVVAADCAGRITEFNPAAEQTFGYSRAEMIGKPLVELVPPSLKQRHLAGFASYLESGIGSVVGKRIEISALHASGKEFPVELAVVPTRLNNNLLFTAYIRDITERRRAAAALQTSEARFKYLADAGMIGIIVTDLLGNIYEANDAFLGIVGFSRDDLEAGRICWADMTPPEWRAADDAAIASLSRTGVASPWEKEYVRKDGTRTPVLVGVAMLDAARGIAFVLDLTAQKRAEDARAQAISFAQRESAGRVKAERALEQTEEQLRQSQKMEAIGLLAGSVAHDFNNLLSVILGYTELLVDDLTAGDPIRDGLTQIRWAAESAGELTRQLLAFGRRQVLEPRVVSLNIAISGMTRMLERIIGEDIELAVLLADELGSTFVDPGQIEQVLLNLVVNARDAMPQGGKLTIETSDVVLDEAYARAHVDVVAGRYVVLAVSDSGAGMDQATQERIFEPFFTTKPKGKGSGLGLSTVYGIVKQSGGSVSVFSELGKGTAFKVYLPRTDAPLVPSAGRARPIRGGHETVLLVEDDERVRALAAAVLRRQGYVVLEAPSGGDALLICEQFVGTIHLLLTDVVMPHMSGRQLWERLSVLRPALKVVFMSGYTDDAIVRHGALTAELAFVQKPLTPSALLAKLRQVLDHEPLL